jgi:hypothetical protein
MMAGQIPNSRLKHFEGDGPLLIEHEEVIQQLIQQSTNELFTQAQRN